MQINMVDRIRTGAIQQRQDQGIAGYGRRKRPQFRTASLRKSPLHKAHTFWNQRSETLLCIRSNKTPLHPVHWTWKMNHSYKVLMWVYYMVLFLSQESKAAKNCQKSKQEMALCHFKTCMLFLDCQYYSLSVKQNITSVRWLLGGI